jgi:XTP/dITP diphosphohydrolase
VLFHAAVAADATEDPFDIDDVADALADKMIRRHPHVFGDAVATTPKRCSSTGMPRRPPKARPAIRARRVSAHMPSLALAQKLLGRAALPLSSSRTPGGQDRTPVGAQSEEELGRRCSGSCRSRRSVGGMPSGRFGSGSEVWRTR